eukprot:5305745-Heterocapsa_arctica.AAC.1
MASLRGSAAFSNELPEVGPAQNASRNPVRISYHPSRIRYMLTGNIAEAWGYNDTAVQYHVKAAANRGAFEFINMVHGTA